jgi:hypothetical protein
MGEKPVGKTLDRINNFKPYAKGNCRWATPTEQARNKTDNVVFEFQGKPRTLPEIAEIIGIKRNTLYSRINLYNWTPERAFTTPLMKRKAGLGFRDKIDS